jgi:hypothetical protein
MLQRPCRSGVARGYDRYAPAYPAIPANANIYTYFFKRKHTNLVLMHN